MPLRLIVSPLVALFLLLSNLPGSHALTIGPSRFEVVLPPGETAGADYYVQNEESEAVHVVVEPENWYKDVYIYDNLPIGDWLQFDTYEFDLKPKEIKKLKMTIKVPKNAKGEICAQIFFGAEVKKEKGVSSSGSIQARLGAVLYVAIKGTETVDAGVFRLDVIKPVKMPGDVKPSGIRIDVHMKNKGNVHLRPTGVVSIENEKGEKVDDIEMESGMSVLPARDNVYSAYYRKAELNKGAYKVKAAIKYGEAFGDPKTAVFEGGFEVNESGEIITR